MVQSGFNPQARESLIFKASEVRHMRSSFNPQARESLI